MIKIIAEIAQGYEGHFRQAQILLDASIKAGADAVKFQLVYADEFCTPDYKYSKLFKSLEMKNEHWESLVKTAHDQGRELHFDIFGEKSLQMADKIKADAVKVHGTDMGNIKLLESVSLSKIKNIYLGVGGGYSVEIENAVKILNGKNIFIIIGFQGYPTKESDNQIDRIKVLKKEYSSNPNIQFGFADHANTESQLAYAIPAVAIGAGVTVLEKHLSLGRTLELEDYESALAPDQFKQFVNTIRICGQALGKSTAAPDFGMSEAERQYRNNTRKHVVASQPIRKGARVSPAEIGLKRTSAKDAMTDPQDVCGRILTKDIAANKPFNCHFFTDNNDEA
tara:strand:+ start:2962 stop:3975 length:1014 start_codon:yes stop_codon:yes gene_type:complete